MSDLTANQKMHHKCGDPVKPSSFGFDATFEIVKGCYEGALKGFKEASRKSRNFTTYHELSCIEAGYSCALFFCQIKTYVIAQNILSKTRNL